MPSLEEALQRAAKLAVSGHHRQAEAICLDLLRQGQSHAQIFEVLARVALFAEGNPEKAVEICRRGMESWPHDSTLLRITGQALGCRGDWQEAYAALLQVLPQEPTDILAMLELGQLAMRLGNWEEALSWFDRSLRQGKPAPDYTPLARYMVDWLSRPLAETPGSGGGLVIFSLPVWGRTYLDIFLRYCLPSLLHESNLPALAEWRLPAFRFYTDGEGAGILAQAPEMARLRRLAEVKVEVIPPEFFQWPGGTITGWFHHVSLHEARLRQADYCPIYGESFFAAGSFAFAAQVMASGEYDVLASQGVGLDPSALPGLEGYRAPATGSIGIPPRDLVDLLLTHVSSRTLDYYGPFQDGMFSPDASNIVYWDPQGMCMRTLQPFPYYISQRVLRPDNPYNYSCADNGLLDALFNSPQEFPRIKWAGHSDDFLNVGLELGGESKRERSSSRVPWPRMLQSARRLWTPVRAWAFARDLRFVGNQPPPFPPNRQAYDMFAKMTEELDKMGLRSRQAFV